MLKQQKIKSMTTEGSSNGTNKYYGERRLEITH